MFSIQDDRHKQAAPISHRRTYIAIGNSCSAFAHLSRYILAAIGLFMGMMGSPLKAADLVGEATVISADTIMIGVSRIHLWGIEGPETGLVCLKDEEEWSCGLSAKAHLETLIAQQEIWCEEKMRQPNGQSLAICRSGRSDLSLMMVLAGYAFAHRRYGEDYTEIEGVAQRQRRGLWASSFSRSMTRQGD